MTFRLITHTSIIDTAPGETAIGRVEIHNDGASSADYTIEVVGLDAGVAAGPVPTSIRVPIDAGQSAVVDVPVVVPRTLGIGQHAAAFEVASSRAGDRPALTPFTLSIASVSRVELVATPSTIRARRRADFHLDVTNNEALPVDVAVTGEAPDVDVAFTPSAFTLQPGQRAVAKGRLRGPRHWSGEPTQHNLLITARGRASSTTLTTPYVQRPLFAHRMRMVLAGVTVVALWLAAIGGVAFWLASRDSGSDASAAIIGVDTDGDGIIDAFRDAEGNVIIATDTDGDGIPDTFVDAHGNVIAGTDTDGDGIPDTLTTVDGTPITAIDTDGDGIPDSLTNGANPPDDEQEVAVEPEATILRGTISLDGDANDATDVAIALTPITLGAATDPAAPIGLRRAETEQPAGKFWPIRQGSLNELVGQGTRRTLSIAPTATQPNADGVWLFTDVLQGQSYELSFSKAGYDTQSFVVTPSDDGAPIDMDVDLSPARGSLSGTVNGPSGVLGGADITITDGTLEFQTTSDSRTGAWSIEGVSTPGIYTMSAVLRGYATAVRQVELTPGQQSSGITLQMQPGLGTLTGHIVDAAGTPVGGVTVTASNGDTTLRSTSLTQGDIGFFSLPQLDVPATYTVTAELEGFVTQSRRVPMNGNVGGIDFTMTSETITLSGRVTSSAGGGIESAGLIISTGDLQFRSSTSAAPNAGIFSIDRLPPGTYTITVEHYQHESATEFITVRAGETPPPLNLTLQRMSGPPQIGMGSLSVKVVNNDVTGVPIEGATVTIKRNRTADAPRSLPGGNALGVTFDEVTVGTYTVLVTKEGFNASQPTIVSVGLNHQEVTVRLQALGSASGTIVDSLTGELLDDYVVTLQQVDAAGNPVGATFGPFVPSDTDKVWSTDSRNLLPTGTYRITVNTPPLGYRVSTTQTPVIDPPEYAQSNMRFNVPVVTNREVPALSVQVSADPYPTITGRVFAPLWNNGVAYTEIDDDSLAVVATCNGTAVQNITYSSNGGNASLRDEYTIDKADIAAVVPPADLPATCDIEITANGRVTGEANDVAIAPSNGNNDPDLLVATALVRPAPPLAGTVFWRDATAAPGARVVPLDAAIATAAPGEAITGFVSTVAPMSAPDTRPSYETDATTGKITATSVRTDGGRWTAPTAATTRPQVFGASTYSFLSDNFQTGSVQFLIDESATFEVVDGSESSTVVTEDADGFAVELRPPDKGSISGTVTIDSTTREYPTDMVSATGVGSTPVPPTTPDATGAFSFLDVDAGTWTVSFATPPNHLRITPAVPAPPTACAAPDSASVTQRVEPGTNTPNFGAHYVEMGTIVVRLTNPSGTPISPMASISLDGYADPNLTDVAATDLDPGPGSDLGYRLDCVPVSAVNPAVTPLPLTLNIDVPGYDTANATVNGNPGLNTAAIGLTMLAGQTHTYAIALEEYGTITGQVQGQSENGSLENLPFTSTDPSELLAEMNVTQVQPNGDALPAGQIPNSWELVGNGDGTFSITAAPGFYRLEPTHPEYGSVLEPPSGSTGTVPGQAANVFQIENARENSITTTYPGPPSVGASYVLVLREGTLTIEAFTALTFPVEDRVAVADAVYNIYRSASTCVGDPDSALELPTTAAPVTLAPGVYCVAINKFGSTTLPDDTVVTTKDAFPAIVTVAITRSTTDAPSRTSIVAALPNLAPSLTGRLVGKNTRTPAGAIDLDSATTPEVTGSFAAPNVVVNGTEQPNENADTGLDATVVERVVADEPITWAYEFEQVPYGLNTITAPPIEGYTLSTPTQAVTVAAMGPTEVPDFVYTVQSADVEFDLGSGAYPSLDPAYPDLKSAAGLRLSVTGAPAIWYDNFSFDTTDPDHPNMLVVKNVAPDSRGFTLEFDDALHVPFSVSGIEIPLALIDQPDPTPPRRSGGTLSPTADRIRLTGDATILSTAGGTSVAMNAGSELTLTSKSTDGETYTIATTGGSVGTTLVGKTYSIDAVADSYVLSLTKPGYSGAPIDPVVLTALGTIRTQSIGITKDATVTVSTISTLAAPTGTTFTIIDTVAGTTISPRSGTTNTFDVPGDRSYIARATTPGTYPDQSSPAKMIPVGTPNGTLDIAMPRYADVNVSGPPAATTITVAIGASTLTRTGPGTIRFASNSATNAIPAGGALTATISASGYRPTQTAIPANIFVATDTVVLYPEVTVTGSITGATDGQSITATNESGTAKSGSINAGTYSIPGLGIGTWTVEYDEVGVGATTAPVTVAVIGADTHPTGSLTGAPVSLTPRDVSFNFAVTTPIIPTPTTGPTRVAVNDATITIFHDTTTLDTEPTVGGTVPTVLTVKENAVPTSWRVTHPDYLTSVGTISAITALTDIPVPVSLVPAITGTVTDGGTEVAGTIRICNSSATSAPCTADDALAEFAAAATGFKFTGHLASSNYKVWAISGTKQGVANLNIGATSATLSPSAIPIATPTP